MGIAATRRGDTLIAKQAEHKYSEHEVAVAKRQILRENQLLAKQVEEQASELAALRAQVAELEALRQANADMAVSLARAEAKRDSFKRLHAERLDAYLSLEKAHNKLSSIVRANISPERWHEWRAAYTDQQEATQP